MQNALMGPHAKKMFSYFASVAFTHECKHTRGQPWILHESKMRKGGQTFTKVGFCSIKLGYILHFKQSERITCMRVSNTQISQNFVSHKTMHKALRIHNTL